LKGESFVVITSRAALSTLSFFALVSSAGLLSADTVADHQRAQTRPILLGSSGGNINDRSNAWCCSGTLGALVTKNGVQYILSNNHVLARTNEGAVGDAIIQPGLIDEAPTCAQDTGDTIAHLSEWKAMSFKKGTSNTVDAAIARVQTGQVSTAGEILGVGVVSATPALATLNMAVRKSGRTTGTTTGVVAAFPVTINVKYGSTCGGGRGTGLFTNQIRVTPGSFSAGGDSGSLIVTTDSTPAAVGLLFAGGTNDTFANPIQAVLNAFPGVTMVGSASLGAPGWFSRWFVRLVPSVAVANAGAPGHPITPASQRAAERAKNRHEAALLAIPGVVGVGVGVSETVAGDAVVEVYVEKATPAARSAVPGQVDGVHVKVVETGEIVARGGDCAL
jgi:hypothetical protein